MAIAVKYNLEMQQMDVVTAFLQGVLKKDIYIENLEGSSFGCDGRFLKLNKSVYGLKQSPCMEYETRSCPH